MDITSLITTWKDRLSKANLSKDYKLALIDCIYEAESFNNTAPQEYFTYIAETLPPEEVTEYLLELEADTYLSSIEANESAI